MSELNLLIDLQKHDLRLKEVQEKLNYIEEDLKLEEIRRENRLLESRQEELNLELGKVGDELAGLNRLLKDNYFKIDDLNKKLYDGSISDIKQLDHMNEEDLELKSETEKLENETLIVMEKQDILKHELDIVLRRLEELASIINQVKESNVEQIRAYKEEQGREQQEREKLLEGLSKEVLSEYRIISASKIDFLAELKDDRCMGCSMILPTYIIDRVEDDQLIRCENCNRILYCHKGLKNDK